MNDDHTETFNAIAAELGAAFIPAKWHSDDLAMTDRGYFVFGDPSTWHTLSLFIYQKYNSDKFTVSHSPTFQFFENGVVKQLPQRPRYVAGAINVSAKRESEAIAKDIKRRLLPDAQGFHVKSVELATASMVDEASLRDWQYKMGVGARGAGRVWSSGEGRADLDASYEANINLKIQWLSREQAEKIVTFLGSIK